MTTSISAIRSRAASVAASASVLLALAACHSGAARSSRLLPEDVTCGQRSAVALYRGRAPRRPTEQTGALVVRLASADSGLTAPEGPVRLLRAGSSESAQSIPITGRVGRTGPLPAGRYVVEATGTGYRPRRMTVSVRAGATDTVRFRLAALCVRRASR